MTIFINKINGKEQIHEDIKKCTVIFGEKEYVFTSLEGTDVIIINEEDITAIGLSK